MIERWKELEAKCGDRQAYETRRDPQSATDDFSEAYAPIIVNGFPRFVRVGRSCAIAADDMALIAFLRNHSAALRRVVEAAKNVNALSIQSDSHKELRKALAELDWA